MTRSSKVQDLVDLLCPPETKISEDHCVQCKEKFSSKNVFSELGWKETRITQMCERCFDDVTLEDEESYF